MNAVQKRKRGGPFGSFGEGGGGGFMVTPIKMSLIRQREISFLKGADFIRSSGEGKGKKIKALLNLKGGVGKCLLASGNINPSEGAQWQDHKYPCFDHSNTHAINQTYIFLSVPADLFVSDTDFSMTTCNSFPLLQNADGPFWEYIAQNNEKQMCHYGERKKSKTKSSFTPAILDPFTQIYINS